MNSRIFVLFIGIVACVVLLFSILIFVEPGMPSETGNQIVYVHGYERHAGVPVMLWDHTYGNGSASAILKTDDGGYLLAGQKEIVEPTDTIQAVYQAWIGKVNSNGAFQWERFYNGSGIGAIMESGGDYIATGDNGGSLWLLETDVSGNVLIEQSFSNSSFTFQGQAINTEGDEGYMIIGNINFPNFRYAAFVAMADRNLTLLWCKDLTAYGIDIGNTIARQADGDFIIGGGEDGNIARIDAKGNILWNTTLGEHVGMLPISLQPADNGSYMVIYLDVGTSWPECITVAKIHPDGSMAWNKTYYGAGSACANSIIPAGDGNYLISGYTSGNLTSGIIGGLYLLKIDDNGTALWRAVYDRGAAGPIVRSDDGGYIVAVGSSPRIELMKFGNVN